MAHVWFSFYSTWIAWVNWVYYRLYWELPCWSRTYFKTRYMASIMLVAWWQLHCMSTQDQMWHQVTVAFLNWGMTTSYHALCLLVSEKHIGSTIGEEESDLDMDDKWKEGDIWRRMINGRGHMMKAHMISVVWLFRRTRRINCSPGRNLRHLIGRCW